MWSALDDQHKGFRCHAGVGVEQPNPETTRLPKLHKSGELARLIGPSGVWEGQPLASLPALHLQKCIWPTGVSTFDSNGLEGPGRVGQILQLNGRLLSPGTGRFI